MTHAQATILGNLARDPELRYTNGNMAICNVGLAVNERYKDSSGDWKDRASFIDVTIFGKRGEAFERYHKKGDTAFVVGKLRQDTWEDKQTGAKRSKLYVVADDWSFTGRGQGQGGSGGSGGGEDRGRGYEPI